MDEKIRIAFPNDNDGHRPSSESASESNRTDVINGGSTATTPVLDTPVVTEAHPVAGAAVSLLEAKAAIVAANALTDAAAGAETQTRVVSIAPPPNEASLLEAKAAIAASNPAISTSSDGALLKSISKAAPDEGIRSSEQPIETSTQRPAPTIGAISIAPQSAGSVSTIQEQAPQQDNQTEDSDDYSSLPTVATAHAVSVAGGSTSTGIRSFEASTVNATTTLDDERARFRQQVRDNLAAEAVQAVAQPNIPAEPNDLLDTHTRPKRWKRQNVCFATVFLIAAIMTVIVASVLVTRRSSSTNSDSNIVSPEVSSTDPPSSTTTPVVVLLPDGRQAFTLTSQLYQAVDDYDAAMEANGTAQDSLVAIQYGYPMGTWDVSRLTNFSHVFMVNRKQELTLTVQLARMREMIIPNLSGWNVSRAATMKGMFAGATAFTGEGLAGWDVGLVTDFSFAFFEASEFVGDLSIWSTSSARTMVATFSEATSFNGDISNWDMSAVETTKTMFSGAFKFQGGDLTRWNVSSVRDMANMFSTTYAFTGNVSSWNTGNVERLDSMFQGATSFNGDLSMWSVDKVTSMSGFLSGADSFTGGDYSRWNTSLVTRMDGMLRNARVFTGDISTFDVSRVTTFANMFDFCVNFRADLSQWDTSAATSFAFMFRGAASFPGNITSWNTSNVNNMADMVHLDLYVCALVASLSSLNIVVCNSFAQFHAATSFNDDLSVWDVRRVKDASRMFYVAESFNQSLCAWKETLPVDAPVNYMFNLTNCSIITDPLLVTTTEDASASWSGPFCSACKV